jgi:hypothetical protein
MVHGRAQGGKNPAELEATWLKTLQEGFHKAGKHWPDSVQCDFPYYADALDRFAAAANLPTPHEILAKGTGQNPQFESFMQSALGEIRGNAALSDAQIEAELPAGAPNEKGVQNWGWVQAIARSIDNHCSWGTDLTIERFLRDVYLYVTNREVARAINAIVEEKLTDEPTLVIAHSLGTVVAYNVIVKNRQKIRPNKFITVGSPLGLRAISSKLGGLCNPAGMNAWYNAYDHRDIVALNPLDETYFPAAPSILNNDTVQNQTDNRHGIVGYLNDRAVAEQVAAVL